MTDNVPGLWPVQRYEQGSTVEGPKVSTADPSTAHAFSLAAAANVADGCRSLGRSEIQLFTHLGQTSHGK